MPENNKTEEFLKKLAPCIERGELEACVEEAARVASEMGIGTEELLVLSAQAGMTGAHALVYVLALATVHGLEEEDKAVAYSNAGFAAQHLKKKEDAEKYYIKAIEANPKLEEAHHNYALLLEEQNRKEEAEEHYKKAIEANPNNAVEHYNYAVLLEEQNRKEAAEEHYKKAIEANPKLVEANSNYALLLQELNRKEEAEKQYTRAIEANPNYSMAHNNYAALLAELNRKDKAEEHYKKAIEINPNYAEAHYNYALLLEEQNRKEEAEEHCKKAIESNPKLADAHLVYGLLLVEIDKRDDAWKETEKASRIFKESGRATYSHLAKALFYQRYADKNLERKKYKESSDDINKSGEEYIKASETVEGKIKYAFELKGNVCKAQSFIRKEHKNNQELVNDLKNASEFYKKASICPAGGTEETCGACHSVMEVFSQALTALEEVVHYKKPSIKKDEWDVKLEKSNEVYLKKGSEKGAALVAALKQLIKCVDELAYYTARKSSLQKKRLKECYKTLEDVSSKVEGGLRNITDPANEVIKNYAKKIGIPMPEEKTLDEPPSRRNIKKLIGYFIILLGVIGSIIAILQFLKQDSSALEFIKSIFSQISNP